MYRLAAIDLDGTLLTPEKKISARTAKVLQKWRAHEFQVVLATARPFYRIRKYLEALDLATAENYAIAFNGGLVMRADGGETIYRHTFTPTETIGIIKGGDRFDCPIFIYLQDKILSNRDDPMYRTKNPDVDFVVQDLNAVDWSDLPVFKCAYVGSPDVVKDMRGKLSADFAEKYEVSSSVPQFVDFVPLGTSKAKALAMIGSRYGIPAGEMVAFGDEDNDVPLLEFAGFGVAMGNASAGVKALADIICASNSDDGVADVLEDLLSGDFPA